MAVPLVGAILVAINTRLSGSEIAYILEHSGASILVVDSELFPVVAPHLADLPRLREVIVADDVGRRYSGRRHRLRRIRRQGKRRPPRVSGGR